MASEYLSKSIYGLSIINNLLIYGDQTQFECNIKPTKTNTFDIGTPTLYWRHIYVESISSPSIVNTATLPLNITASNLTLNYNDNFILIANTLVDPANTTLDTLSISQPFIRSLFSSVNTAITYSNTDGKITFNYDNTKLDIISNKVTLKDPYILGLFQGSGCINYNASSTKGTFGLSYDTFYLTVTGINLTFSTSFVATITAMQSEIATNTASILAEVTRAETAESLLSAGILANTTAISVINGTLTGYLTKITTNELYISNTNTKQIVLIDYLPTESNTNGSQFIGFGIGVGDVSQPSLQITNKTIGGFNFKNNGSLLSTLYNSGFNINSNNASYQITDTTNRIGGINYSNGSLSLVSNSITKYSVDAYSNHNWYANSATMSLGNTGLFYVPKSLFVNSSSNIYNKLLILYDSGPIDNVATATNFFGFGINSYTLRYQAPVSAYHRFYVDTTEVFHIGGEVSCNVIFNANSTINCGIVVSSLTSGTNINITNFATGNIQYENIITPNIVVGSVLYYNFGVSATTNNQGQIQFNYAGSGSGNNTIGFGFSGNPNFLTIDATAVIRVGGQFVNKKKLVLYDGNITEGSSGTNFYGLGMDNSTLRYQVPGGSFHRFYVGTSGVLFEVSSTTSTFNSSLNVNSALYCNSLQIGTSTTISNQGGYIEWNRSNGGGELEITNQQGGGSDNSIYLSSSDISNNRTRWFQFYSGGITKQNGGNLEFNIVPSATGDFSFGRYAASNFNVYNTGLQLSITSAGVSINYATISTLSANAIVSNTIRSLTGIRVDGWNPTTGYSVECFSTLSVNSSASVNVGYNMIIKSSSGTTCGSIYNNGSNAIFSISSDYRVKKEITPIIDALTLISKLKPCNYKYKSNNHQADGFIAHELQEVLPYAVVGEKDAVDNKGEMMVQGVDYSMLTPILTAGIQQLILENKLLHDRLDKLELKINN